MRNALLTGAVCSLAFVAGGCSGGLNSTFGHHLDNATPAAPTASPSSAAGGGGSGSGSGSGGGATNGSVSPTSASPTASPSSAPTVAAVTPTPSGSATPANPNPAPTATPFTGATVSPPPATAAPTPLASPFTTTFTIPDASQGASIAIVGFPTNPLYSLPLTLRVPPSASGVGPVRVDFNAVPTSSSIPQLAAVVRQPRALGSGSQAVVAVGGYVALTATTSNVSYVQSPELWYSYVPFYGSQRTFNATYIAFFDGSATPAQWIKLGSVFVQQTNGTLYAPGYGLTYTLQPGISSSFAMYNVF